MSGFGGLQSCGAATGLTSAGWSGCSGRRAGQRKSVRGAEHAFGRRQELDRFLRGGEASATAWAANTGEEELEGWRHAGRGGRGSVLEYGMPRSI